MKYLEFVGVLSGIIGSFLVANTIFQYGYSLFLVSSMLLVITALKQRNYNLVLLQGVFLLANINGVFTFFLER